MPRLKNEKKRVGKDTYTNENSQQWQKEKALKALKIAKKIEAERLASGYRYLGDRKTKRLCKPIRS